MTRLSLLLTFAALGAVLGVGCSKSSAKPEAAASATPAASVASTPAVRVEVAQLSASTETLNLSLPGEVEAARDALLAASLGGHVERVQVKTGDRVKRGQALVWVDSASHRARLKQARVEQEAAERELARAKALGKAIAKAELDAADTRLRAARAAVSTARVSASRAVIQAPFAGTVVDVDVEVGEVAAPGAPLVRVVQLDPVLFSVAVSDRDVVALKEGATAQVRFSARGKPATGVVKTIKRAADLRTRAFEAEIQVDNPKGEYLPGMIASVSLESTAEREQIVLSQDWLVTRSKDVGVFVVQKDVVRWRALQLGPVMRDRVAVDAGLKSGETIVITGHRELVDGDRILVSRRGKCCREGRVEFE
ncbi:MAG TPA: efflux RND transporter periplasmic adaptor subunit [Polyangiaceae bacterium]|nr:efflux RND transporter periplasmic adaptor subunit [Polyangiaceae bacterium]